MPVVKRGIAQTLAKQYALCRWRFDGAYYANDESLQPTLRLCLAGTAHRQRATGTSYYLLGRHCSTERDMR